MKTHKERSEEAAREILRRLSVTLPTRHEAEMAHDIAQLTYPTELLKSAKAFPEAAHNPASYVAALAELRAALALYEPPGEPGKEG